MSKGIFTSTQKLPCLQWSPQKCISITGQNLQIERTAHWTFLIPGGDILFYSVNFLCQPIQCVLGW